MQSISRVIRGALWLPLIRPVRVLPLTALPACVANTSGLAGGLLPAAISADAFSLCYPLQSDVLHLNNLADVVEMELLEISNCIQMKVHGQNAHITYIYNFSVY